MYTEEVKEWIAERVSANINESIDRCTAERMTECESSGNSHGYC